MSFKDRNMIRMISVFGDIIS